MKNFNDLISEIYIDNFEIKDLPVIHTTTESVLFNIMLEKQLKSPKKCKVYEESLVYFFYGKASFYTDTEIINFSTDPPLCILFDSENLNNENLKRVLPFDSGGYDRYNITKYSKDQFTVSNPKLDVCRKLIYFLYDTNQNYLKNKITNERIAKNISKCWPLNSLLELYSKKFGQDIKTGEHVFSIEMQFGDQVAFNPSALILPYSFLESGLIVIDEFKVDFPNIELHFYGLEEIIEADGKSLTGQDYYTLMQKKLKNILLKNYLHD